MLATKPSSENENHSARSPAQTRVSQCMNRIPFGMKMKSSADAAQTS